MGKYDFKPSSRPDTVHGAWHRVVIDFTESGDECWKNTYPTVKDAVNAATALQHSIKAHGYMVKASRTGLAVYLLKEQ